MWQVQQTRFLSYEAHNCFTSVENCSEIPQAYSYATNTVTSKKLFQAIPNSFTCPRVKVYPLTCPKTVEKLSSNRVKHSTLQFVINVRVLHQYQQQISEVSVLALTSLTSRSFPRAIVGFHSKLCSTKITFFVWYFLFLLFTGKIYIVFPKRHKAVTQHKIKH